jgi:hypothetical protein
VWRFKRTQITSANHVASLGLDLHSDARDDLLIDKDARLCSMTNQRCPSSCHFKDLPQLQSGAQLALYLKTKKRSNNVVLKPFNSKLLGAAQFQRDAAVGGDITSLAGKSRSYSRQPCSMPAPIMTLFPGASLLARSRRGSLQRRDSL